MTNEEVLKDIRRMLRGLSKGNIKYGSHSMHNWQFIVTMALEKQIPKKPYKTKEHKQNEYYCTICKRYLGDEMELKYACLQPSYCEHCGQALDWSDDE